MSLKQKQLTATLNEFYHKPVARVSLELFLSIGLIIFLDLFAIQPTLTTITELIEEIEEKRDLTEKLDNKIAALTTAQTTYYSIESRLPVLDEAIPSNPEVVKSLKIVEKLAYESSVVVTSISVPQVPDELHQEVEFNKLARVALPLTVTVSGDYLSIKEYVQTIMNSRKLFVVDSVTFQTSEDRGNVELSASITLLTPYFGLDI